MGTVALPFFTTPQNLHSVNRGKSRPIQTYAFALTTSLQREQNSSTEKQVRDRG